MAFKMTDEQKESHVMMKGLIDKKPRKLKASDFKPGSLILFSYNAKYKKNPYDKTPLCFVISTEGRKYLYGINFSWIPPALRKGIMDMILKKNKKNIEKGLDLEIPKLLLMKIARMGLPAFRRYLKNRVSPSGIIIGYENYAKVIHLRGEHFTGISSEQAWNIAVAKIKKNKKKVARK